MRRNQKITLLRIILAAVLFVFGLLFSVISRFSVLSTVCFVVSYFTIGYDVLWKAVRGISRGQFLDENFLMALASVAALVTGEVSESAAVMLFYQVGELFQDIAVGKSRKNISSLLDIMPENASVFRDGKWMTVDPSEVTVGENILVRPGERIPLDGCIINGRSSLNTAALTGEALPRDVSAGDTVLSGCVNLSESLQIRVQKPFEESTVARILNLVEESASKKAKTEAFITKFSKVYTPLIVLLAVFTAVLPPLFLGIGDWAVWKHWIHSAMIFLVISCPCALVISVPMAFFGGIGAASSHGILVKGSCYLENLSKCDTVVFDKTGTLTEGKFSISNICPQPGITKSQLLTVAALAEKESLHPIAISICSSCEIPDTVVVLQSKILNGFGVETKIRTKEGNTSTVYAGNAELMKSLGICVAPVNEIGTAVYVVLNQEENISPMFLGLLVVSDCIKKGAKETLHALHQECFRSVMLTGDNVTVAKEVAEKIGVREYKANLLPEDKVKHVELLKNDGCHTIFVGDGINDSPVLAVADVGIAMGALGSDAAIEAADIVLADDHLEKIPLAIRISRATLKIAKQNIVLALSVKFLVLVLDFSVALGVLTALSQVMTWLAVVADVGVAVLAILNAMRILGKRF